jgi:hypothetical protein
MAVPMQSALSVSLTVLLFCGTLFGQSASPATPSQTFHVRVTITDPSGAVIRRAKIAFQNKQFDKTVTTNDVGVYEADLPLGNYTMTAQSMGFRPYRRPLFRVTSAAGIAFDVTLPVQSTCDIVVVNSEGGAATPEEWAGAKKELCLHEDFLPAPSRDGVPFELYIRYVKHTVVRDRYTYTGEKTPNEDPVFVAYNLFSLRADEVVYVVTSRTIKASGNVVAIDESGATQRADTMSFKLENGQATPLR